MYLMVTVSYLHDIPTVVQSAEQALCGSQLSGRPDWTPYQLHQLVGPEGSAWAFTNHSVHSCVQVWCYAKLILIQQVSSNHSNYDCIFSACTLPNGPEW